MTEVLLPKMGESVTEARIIRWLKKPGDAVEADEPILEIATDKVDSEVPAPASGILQEIRVKEGETVPVGTVLAIIAAKGEALPAASAPAPEEKNAPEVVPQPQRGNGQSVPDRIPARHGDRFYSPLVRTIAQQEGISLGGIL